MGLARCANGRAASTAAVRAGLLGVLLLAWLAAAGQAVGNRVAPRGPEHRKAELLAIRNAAVKLGSAGLRVGPSPVAMGSLYHTLWHGARPIGPSTDSRHTVSIPASAFARSAAAVPGNILRLFVADLTPRSKVRCYRGGRTPAALADTEGAKTFAVRGGHYLDYALTEQLLYELGQDGLVVGGEDYTLTRVAILCPASLPTLAEGYFVTDIREWRPGEVPRLTLTFTNTGEEDIATDYCVDVYTDSFVHLRRYSGRLTVPAGSARFTHEVRLPVVTRSPGFYRVDAMANCRDVCSLTIGYDVGRIACPPTAPPDFRAFWQRNLSLLAAVPPGFGMELMPELSSADRNVYLVEMKSAPDSYSGEPVTNRGYYAEPVEPGCYPAIVRYQGTDNGTPTPDKLFGSSRPGWCELLISTRYQLLNRCDNHHGPAGSADYDFYAWGLVNDAGDGLSLENHYFRGAYLDCVRAIDFLASREKVDIRNIFAAGYSQGGAFCYVAAALEAMGGPSRLAGIAPSITGHSDMRHRAGIADWPAATFRAVEEETGIPLDVIYDMQAYFDVMNFATHVDCPVITNLSLQDATAPPHAAIVPYNLLRPERRCGYTINTLRGHTQAPDWGDTYTRWFETLVKF